MFAYNLQSQLLSVKYVSRCIQRNSMFESNYQILTQCFGLQHDKAHKYIECQRLNHIPPEILIKSVTFCKEIGYDDNSILGNPILLRANPLTLDQHYLVLNEGGFTNIAAPVLAKTLYKKRICDLKIQGFIDGDADVGHCFIQHLKPCPENFHVNTKSEETWSNVYKQVLFKYLKWRLKLTDEDLTKLIRTHSRILNKSFKYLCQNIDITEQLGLTRERIFKNGYVLHNYPKYTQEVLERYPEIAGASMRAAMNLYPKLIMVSPSNIEKIYNILQFEEDGRKEINSIIHTEVKSSTFLLREKVNYFLRARNGTFAEKHSISDLAIQRRMNVFHLSPETVEYRLRELENDPDLKVLFHNPNILKLVVHHNRAKSRQNFLNELELKCTGVAILGSDDDRFDVHVRDGRDINTRSDTNAFLKGLLNEDVSQFKHILKKHPYHLQVPLLSMKDTYLYLKGEKFSNNAILNVIYILLYPKEKVENGLSQLRRCEKFSSKTVSQVNELNLVLYFIEKEHHFSGDGVWAKTDLDSEEPAFETSSETISHNL